MAHPPRIFFLRYIFFFFFFLTGDIIKLARIQINTSSPHCLSPDQLSQRWKTLPLRLFNTWGLCAGAKSPAVSGTATGQPTEGERFETEGQLPHFGGISGREPANSCGFVDLLRESYGAGIWPLFGERWQGLEKENRTRKKENETYLENNTLEM